MPDLFQVTENLKRARGAQNHVDARREFMEVVTYATADEILAVLRGGLEDQWGLPVWATNLAYRLACLQRPDDPELLREAAGDLLAVGPDWDEHAEALFQRADQLENPDTTGDPS